MRNDFRVEDLRTRSKTGLFEGVSKTSEKLVKQF